MATTSTHPELAAVEVHGMTRGAFILRGALAAGAVYGLGAVTPYVSSALGQDDTGDLDIVNFALTLEYLETAFYAEARKLALNKTAMDYAKTFGDEEAAHVDALTATARQLGGTPAKKPTFTFPMKDQKSFVKLATVLEDTGVSAYNGAGPSIKSKDVLAAAGSIVQIEARHAAAIRILGGAFPAPSAFDRPLDTAQVMAAVKPFIAS
jgi:hypothetical protein